MGLEEVFKRQNENQKTVSWKLEAASQLVRGNEQISLSSVHKKPVSTGEYLTRHVHKHCLGSSGINVTMGVIPGFTSLSLCNSCLCQ